MRTYAIYGKSWVVFFILLVPGVCVLASGVVRFRVFFPPALADFLKKWLIVVQTTSGLPPELQIGPLTCNFSSSSSVNAGFVSPIYILLSVLSEAFYSMNNYHLPTVIST